MLLLLMAALLCADTLPEPIAHWEISYVPAFALLDENGSALVLDQSGLNAYQYDNAGQLLSSFTLERAALAGYKAPDGTPILYLEGGLLAGLNPNGSLRWQRQLAAPTAPPEAFAKLLVYAEGDHVMLLDPQDGSTRFSLQHDRTIVASYVFNERIWISDDAGTTLTWEPFSELKQRRYAGRPQVPVGALQLADGSIVQASDDGLVELLRANGRRRWQRNFHIDFASKPLLLQGKDEAQLVMATKGRNLVVLEARDGDLLLRKLLLTRVRALVAFGQERALVIGDQSRELLWYHAPSAGFASQSLPSLIDDVAESESYLLLMADDGTMRLFNK